MGMWDDCGLESSLVQLLSGSHGHKGGKGSMLSKVFNGMPFERCDSPLGIEKELCSTFNATCESYL